jgi:hypothetical protein
MISQVIFINFDALIVIINCIIDVYEEALVKNCLIFFFSDSKILNNWDTLLYIIYWEFKILDFKLTIYICYLLKKLYIILFKKK